MHFWSKFGDSNLNKWKVMVRTSSKWGKIRPWWSGSITPKTYRHLNQGVLRLSSKFGDSSVNGWWVIVSYRADKLVIDTHTHTNRHTDAGDDNTRRPKLASGKNEGCAYWIWKHKVLTSACKHFRGNENKKLKCPGHNVYANLPSVYIYIIYIYIYT